MLDVCLLEQELSGLHRLPEFHGTGLDCREAHYRIARFSGPLAQELWTVALGWPQLLDFEVWDCTLNPDPYGEAANGDIQTAGNSSVRWAIKYANASF